MEALTLYQSSVARAIPTAANEAAWLDPREVEACQTYRDACRLCWRHRKVPGLLFRTLAELCDLDATSVTDYFHPDARNRKNITRRKLPAEAIPAVERVLGNRAISQWLAYAGEYRIAEEVLANLPERRVRSA